ncbi:MAG: cytochrome C oxidase subunit IV family protein [bacterium]|nr:cytochrome C oxidase subunit IV family protein [bacterium]
MHIPDQESRGHILPRKTYLLTGAALLVLTVITVAASFVDWGGITGLGFAANITVAMLIATVKAMLVIMVFMHMKYEGWLTWGFGLIYPIVIFIILMIFLVTDVFLRVVPEEPAILKEASQSSLMIDAKAAPRVALNAEIIVE